MKKSASISFLMIVGCSAASASIYNPTVELLQRNLILINYKSGPTEGLWMKQIKSYHLFFVNMRCPYQSILNIFAFKNFRKYKGAV